MAIRLAGSVAAAVTGEEACRPPRPLISDAEPDFCSGMPLLSEQLVDVVVGDLASEIGAKAGTSLLLLLYL